MTDRPVAAIGETLSIKGDVSANEDLVVRGAIHGNIAVNEHHVHIDEPGRLDGNIIAKEITIRGDVRGDLQGLEKVSILSTGRLEGKISAPRIVLADGGCFKGLIDMPARENTEQRKPSSVSVSQRPKKETDLQEPSAGQPRSKAKL